jgi:hypothetical protein
VSGWDDGGAPWRAGRWSLDRRDDEIADLAFDGRPVLRSIRAVVRDRDWNTAGWTLGDVETDGRMLRIPLSSDGYGSDIRGEVRVETSGDTVVVSFEAVSHTDFDTNRAGLVVLHPPQLAGADLQVTHPLAGVTETRFPAEISAHQPVFDIAGLAWEHQGLEVAVAFTGDVFEMEDQRNWTDASYKTYSRPLSLPFPYPLAAGDRIVQRVEVRVREVAPAASGDGETVIALAPAGAFPAVNVSASNAPDPEPADLPPIGAELVVELDLRTPAWPAALERAASRGLPLDVRAVLDDPDPELLGALAHAIRGRDVARVAVFHPFFHVSEAAFVAVLRAALADAGVIVPVVGGSRSHFTELNRERERMPGDLDGLVVTVTPLFHALSSAQLRESVAMQRLVAAQTVAHAGGLPVRVGPITLRPRFNDVATGPQPAPARADLVEGYGAEFTGSVDERQASSELAAWTIASAAALAVPGVAGLTYFEEWGPRGIRSAAGEPYPVAAAIEALAGLAGTGLLAGDSPDGLVWAVGARGTAGGGGPSTGGDGTTVLVANLDRIGRSFTVTAPVADAAPRRIPVVLPSLAWARLA